MWDFGGLHPQSPIFYIIWLSEHLKGHPYLLGITATVTRFLDACKPAQLNFYFYCVEFHLWNSCLLCIAFHKISSMAGGTSYSYTYNLTEDVHTSVVQTLHSYVEF